MISVDRDEEGRLKDGKNVLEVQNVTKEFGSLVALNNVSIWIEEGKITGLIGPNGAGKTTLFNVITGQFRADKGKVFFRGKDITKLKPYQIARRGIGRTWQVIRIFPNMTVLENLMTAANLRERNAGEKALELLELAGLVAEKDSYAGELSTGQQKFLELVRILMFDADVMLLDEVAAGINPTEQLAALELIHNLCDQKGKTFFIVEHDMDVIMGHCDKVICLNFGEKIAEGTPKEVQNNEKVIRVYFGA
ncbi:Lipopolysaccharide export system ATP-binding protein LptB [subsurface metagenome]|nr:ATP-binding cassette domain-containing protein [Dehalococcoidia bacterium]